MILKRLFGGAERQVNRLKPIVEKINELEPAVSKLSDEELRGKRDEFKKRLEKGEKTDDILPEAF